MECFTGRPADCAGREAAEVRVYDLLDGLGIEYLRVDHEAAATMAGCEEADAALGVRMCKNLFLCNRQQTRFYLLMMPGGKPFRTKELSAQLGIARLSFAGEAHMLELLGLHPGSVSVTGLMNDPEGRVMLLIDEDLLEAEYVGCHPNRNTSSVRFRTEELLKKLLPALHHEPVFVRLSGGDAE